MQNFNRKGNLINWAVQVVAKMTENFIDQPNFGLNSIKNFLKS